MEVRNENKRKYIHILRNKSVLIQRVKSIRENVRGMKVRVIIMDGDMLQEKSKRIKDSRCNAT